MKLNFLRFLSLIVFIILNTSFFHSAKAINNEGYILLKSDMNIKFTDSSNLKLPIGINDNIRFFKIIGNNLVIVADANEKDSSITRSFIFVNIKSKKTDISVVKIPKAGSNYFLSVRKNSELKIFLRKKYSSLTFPEMLTKFILERQITSFDYYFGNIVYSTAKGSIVYYNFFERTIRKLLNNNSKNQKSNSMVNFSLSGDKIIYISNDSLKSESPQNIICLYDIKKKNVYAKIRIPFASQAKLSKNEDKLIVLVSPENKVKVKNKAIISLPVYNKIIIYNISKKKTDQDIYEIDACWEK